MLPVSGNVRVLSKKKNHAKVTNTHSKNKFLRVVKEKKKCIGVTTMGCLVVAVVSGNL